MTEAESNPVRMLAVAGGKALLGGAIGFGAASFLSPLFWYGVRKVNPRIQVPIRRFMPRHASIGRSLMVAGIMSRSPLIAGIGGGMVASNTDTSTLRKEQMVKQHAEFPDRLNIVRYNIPDWLPWRIRYDMLGDILVEIITKPTWNAEKKTWIPPGREHPDIMAVAREIVVSNRLDGHDKMAVLNAIQTWVKSNITYVYDPRWLDFFQHPYITLQKRAEDCDGQALLVASLGEAVGIPMVLILVGQKDPTQFNHVLAGGVVNGKIHSMETILKNVDTPLGWMPPHIHTKIIRIP
jgi:hypothetical protein